MINLYNQDCINAMAGFNDNQFDLAIVDPPYGSDNIKGGYTKKGYCLEKAAKNNYHLELWNQKAPNNTYFTELQRVSKHQIIWGANHFISKMPYDSSCWIVWDKDKSGLAFADCELAWTSFNKAVRKIKIIWDGFRQDDMKNKEKKIHPTQKPVKLYEWLLMNYAKEGDKILDTYLGSGSIAIACYNLGYDLEGYEIDKQYYDAAKKRVQEHQSQLRMF